MASAAREWTGAIDTLIASPSGREILANVLEAAAEALRRVGPGVGQAAEAGAQQVMETSEAAAEIGTEVASGTMALAQTAAGVLADVVTDAARSLLPETGSGTTRRGQRRRSTDGRASE
jgi:type IV secretory pathway TrbL component